MEEEEEEASSSAETVHAKFNILPHCTTRHERDDIFLLAMSAGGGNQQSYSKKWICNKMELTM